ncbi:MAG: hypothetical protein QXE31_02860 [Candidatus Woesearchaeota archaeon]
MSIDKSKEKEMVIKSTLYPYSKCLNCVVKAEKNFLINRWCNFCNQESRVYER